MRLLGNQRGDAFLFALLMVAATGIIFLGTQVVQESAQRRLNLYRIKSQMTLIEERIRMALVQPQAYQGCQTFISGSKGCSLNMEYLKNFSTYPAIGLPCAAANSADCGFIVKDWDLKLSSSEVKVILEFKGSSQLQTSKISIQVPEELLQAQVFNCPSLDPNSPVFMGIEPLTGKIKCRSLPVCGTGEYMIGVTANQANSICRPIPTNVVSCGTDKLIKRFSWKGTTFESSCADRLDPYSYFGGP